jgi:hypothetical protein
VPQRKADLGDRSKWRRTVSPLVVDVGANIGWFTLNAAAAGGRVAAFEGVWCGPIGVCPLHVGIPSACDSAPWRQTCLLTFGDGTLFTCLGSGCR